MKTKATLWLILFFSAMLQAQNYELVWQDEFDKLNGRPDPAKWTYEEGDGCPANCGWGNKEQQYYTDKLENVRVENGLLVIEVHQKSVGNSSHTSGKINSKMSGKWQYGKMEIRARLPRGIGTWPAIWMLPAEWKYGGWPNSGEIDIMEHVGWAQDSLFGTVHTVNYNHMNGTQKGNTIHVPDISLKFHTFSIIWEENKIDYFVDGNKYFSFYNDGTGSGSWPFDQAFYLILNVAVGGNFGGVKGVDPDIWPQRMEVDYVRVYQLKS